MVHSSRVIGNTKTCVNNSGQVNYENKMGANEAIQRIKTGDMHH